MAWLLATALHVHYLHIFQRIFLCWVGTATLASLLGVAIDLTFIAGFRWQWIVIHITSLSITAACKAQTCNTVPGAKTKLSVNEEKTYLQLSPASSSSRTLVPHGSIQGDIHRGSPHQCLSSRICRGSDWWSTRWRLNSLHSSGHNWSQWGRGSGNFPMCYGMMLPHRSGCWDTRSHLGLRKLVGSKQTRGHSS